MTSAPLVSIIVLTYNHSSYIEKCVTSLLNQKTDFDFEIVLGEDGSTDGTREKCIEIAKNNPSIKLILQDRANVIYINGAPTGRYNFMTCYASTRGKYVAWCEGDDFWESTDKLQKQVDILEQNPLASGSFHDTFFCDYQDVKTGLFRENLLAIMNLADTISSSSPFHTSSFMVRKSSLELPNFMWSVMSSDMAVFALAASKGPLLKVENVWSAYRKHDAGMTNVAVLKASYHQLRIEMLSTLSNYLGGASKEKFDEVIQKHQSAIQKAKEWEKPKSLTSRVLNRARRIFPKKK